MTQTELRLMNGLAWLVLVVGLVALVALRRRSPRATGLALPGVAALLLVQAAATLLVGDFGLPGGVVRALTAAAHAAPVASAAGLLLLVGAVTADRSRAGRA